MPVSIVSSLESPFHCAMEKGISSRFSIDARPAIQFSLLTTDQNKIYRCTKERCNELLQLIGGR